MRSGPFLMSNSGNESHGQAASYAFGFVKKYLFFQKLQPKTFLVKKTQLDVLKNIFEKTFQKSKILIFEKTFFRVVFVEKSMKIENFKILKNQNFGFLKIFFQKTELSFFDHTKFSAVTFRKINIFI